MMNLQFNTQRLCMTPVGLSDTPFIKSLFQNEDVKRFYVLREDHKANLDSFVQYIVSSIQQGASIQYIMKLSDGTPIGLVGGELNKYMGEVQWNVSYAVLPRYRNNGYASEALKGFTDFVTRFNIPTAFLDISEYNNVSESVAKNAGYKKLQQIGNIDQKHPELGIHFHWVRALHSKRDQYVSMANQAYRIKDYRTAAKYYELALTETNQQGGPNTDALCYSNLGMACSSYGDYQKAFQCLKKAQSLGLYNASIDKELRWLKEHKGIF